MAGVSLSRAFGLVLRKYRIEQQLSQEALAERARIHPTHVGLIERGLRNPSLNVAKALATALRVPLSELIRQAEGEPKGRGR